jgi:hypothetical protein
MYSRDEGPNGRIHWIIQAGESTGQCIPQGMPQSAARVADSGWTFTIVTMSKFRRTISSVVRETG